MLKNCMCYPCRYNLAEVYAVFCLRSAFYRTLKIFEDIGGFMKVLGLNMPGISAIQYPRKLSLIYAENKLRPFYK